MYKILTLVVTIAICMSCGNSKKEKQAEKQNDFSISITGQENFPEGTRISMYRMKVEEVPDNVEILKEGLLGKDGFVYKGTVEDPHTIAFNVLPADSEYPYTRVYLVLEPGETNIEFTSQKSFKLKGGRLNELVVNSWNENLDFKNARKKYYEAVKVKGDKKLKGEARKAYFNTMVAVNDTKNHALGLAFNATDNSFEKLLIYSVGYQDTDDLDALNTNKEKLAMSLFEKREAKLMLKNIKRARESAAAMASVGVGSVIKDFKAQNLKGEMFHLADVLKKNKYVLVEFWSSWCGPCRAEIPHMKKAYAKYKSEGFEIVSFTLDNKKKNWEKASKEEQIPWIDTGDLKAMTSPVVKMYGVVGVPANYLVEANTGKIIAMNLRQEKLDEKLKEVFNKKH